MPQIDRFLRHRPSIPSHGLLGLGYTLVRETWDIGADPKTTPPIVEVVASRRSAAEAADLGRCAAQAFGRHGFHRASRASWATEGRLFHRFAVRPHHRARTALLLGLGLAGLAALARANARGRLRAAA